MVYLVAAETLLLLVVLVLVAGLLRSHAEVLRRLGPPEEDVDGGAVAGPPERAAVSVAPDVAGTTLDGDAVKLTLSGGAPLTLLAFLSSGCETCGRLWPALDARAEIPGAARLVVITKDTSHESPSRLRELASPDVALVMSSAAWSDYRVPGSPYFILVDGASGQVHGEGSATSWEQIASLMRDAVDDAAGAGAARTSSERALRAERALSVAGIGPGHPSLHPGEEPGDPDGERP